MKLKKGDNVIVVTGTDRGKKGVIAQVLAATNQVIIDGVNVMKKHIKPRMQGQSGNIIEKAMPIDASNVQIIDPKGGKPTRVGYELKDGKKIRIARGSGSNI
jgi:large subunit ribosomal protein L24